MRTYNDIIKLARDLWGADLPLNIDVSLDELMLMAGWSQATEANVEQGNIDIWIQTIYGNVQLHLIDET